MGVIQSSINQAIGAAGEAIRDVKLLGKAGELTQGQQKIREGVANVGEGVTNVGKDVKDIVLIRQKELEKRKKEEWLQQDRENAKEYGMTLEEYQKWENELHEEEMAEIRADREEEVKRENELRKAGLRRSKAEELKAKQDLKDHERLRNSPLGGGLNG